MKKSILLALLFTLAVSYVKGQSVSILGDSYSTYEGYLTPNTNEVWYYAKNGNKKTDVTSVTQTWWWQYINENKYKLCVNNSYSGATISYTGYDGNDYSARSFITRMDNLGCPDILFVFGATNDSWANAPIGEYEYANQTKGDLYSFRPAMAYLMEHLKYRYPNVKIYFILNDGLSNNVSSSVKTICDYYKIQCIELHDIDKMSGHPSVKGHKQIAEQIEAMLNKVKNN